MTRRPRFPRLLLTAVLAALFVLSAGCQTTETYVASTGEVRFGLDEDGRMTVATRNEVGGWGAPAPLTPEHDAAYARILGRRPCPGEVVSW